MSKAPVKKVKKQPTDPKRWLAEAGKEARGLIQKQPIRWAFRFFICFLFMVVVFQQMAVQSMVAPPIALAAVVYFLLTGYRLLQPMFAQGREVRQWALEEQEHITMAGLTGKNQEELEQLLQYHIKYGNVQEADRISKQLLALVDKDNFPDTAAGMPVNNPATAAGLNAAHEDPGVAIKISPGSTLPNWLRDEDDKSTTQPTESPGEKLPDWMN